MKTWLGRFGGLITILMAVAAQNGIAVAGPLYELTDLGDLPGGEDFSLAYAINARGQVVGESATANGSGAFLWDNAGGIQPLGTLPDALGSVAMGISDDTLVVGTSFGGEGGYRAFVWDRDDGMQGLSEVTSSRFLLRGNRTSRVVAISPGGTMVGNRFRFDEVNEIVVRQIFVWDRQNGARDITLSDPLGGYLAAIDINDAGQIIAVTPDGGSGWTGSGYFIDSSGHVEEIGNKCEWDESLVCGGYFPYAINSAGQVVGRGAFLWDSANGLGFLPGLANEFGDPIGCCDTAYDVNTQGQIVGANSEGALLWDPQLGVQDLNLLADAASLGWRLSSATAINDAGQIVGYGYNPEGVQHAFLLTPVPEPASVALVLIGLLGLAMARAARRRAHHASKLVQPSRSV